MNLLFGRTKPFSVKWPKDILKNVLWIKRFMLLFVSILAGLCLFILVVSLIVYTALLNADFHEKLLAGEDVFSCISSITQKTINNLNITPEMVQSNLYSIIRGLISYVKGTENLLPDIYFDSNSLGLAALGNTDNYLDKINLSTILLFLNRSYISDSLTILRLLYECLKTAFNIVTIFFFFLVIIILITANKRGEMIKYWHLLICFPGSLCLISGFISFLYSKNKLPGIIHALSLQVDISQDIKVDLAYMLTSYAKKCLNYMTFCFILSGVALISVSILVSLILKFSLFKSCKNKHFTTKPFLTKIFTPTSSVSHSNKTLSLSKSRVFLFVIVLVTILLMQKIGDFNEDYKINSFLTLASRIREYGSATPVILAKDDNIYLLQVCVVDENNGEPVQGIKVALINNNTVKDYENHRSNPNNVKSVNEVYEFNSGGMDYKEADISTSSNDNYKNPDFIKESITDNNGVVNFFIDNGIFSVKLYPSSDSNKYYLPAPFPVNVKAAGSNVITVYLPYTPSF